MYIIDLYVSTPLTLSLSKLMPKTFALDVIIAMFVTLRGTGDSRESIRANHSQLRPLFFIARQADSPESLEFPIRVNQATKLLIMALGTATCNFKFEQIQCTEAARKQEASKGRIASVKGP